MRLNRRAFLLGGTAALALGTSAFLARTPDRVLAATGTFEIEFTEAEWRDKLDDGQYAVLREHATERPYTSPLNDEKRAGTYACAGCALPLFSSDTKFDSGTGWPSFYQPLPDAIGETEDASLGMVRTEVHCARCGGHQGHVFNDGPPPTGLRYCINGLALSFTPAA